MIGMLETGKAYEVKDWFVDKVVANEVAYPVQWGASVFAVLKETEKAVYAMLNLGEYRRKCMWVPKSALDTFEVGDDAETAAHHYETVFNSDYDECLDLFKAHWSQFV